jgi:hypothetical protein
MNFELNKWYLFRKQAAIIGNHIASFKDENGIIALEKEEVERYIADITAILKKSSKYLTKCGLTHRPSLWKYNVEDPTTQPSSIAFKYKSRMSKQEIKDYGIGFMSEPLPNPNELHS